MKKGLKSPTLRQQHGKHDPLAPTAASSDEAVDASAKRP